MIITIHKRVGGTKISLFRLTQSNDWIPPVVFQSCSSENHRNRNRRRPGCIKVCFEPRTRYRNALTSTCTCLERALFPLVIKTTLPSLFICPTHSSLILLTHTPILSSSTVQESHPSLPPGFQASRHVVQSLTVITACAITHRCETIGSTFILVSRRSYRNIFAVAIYQTSVKLEWSINHSSIHRLCPNLPRG